MEYQHGGDIYSNDVKMDFSANINPLGLPEGVKMALHQTVDSCSCYPDSRCGLLREKIGAHHQVPPGYIICGNGAADLIFQVVQAVKPKCAVVMAPSFLEYSQAALAFGCSLKYFELREDQDFRFDAEVFLSFLKREEKPDMVFLCNPNNPTGQAAGKDQMETVLDFCEASGIVCVVDECFVEFLENPKECSVLEEVAKGRWEKVFLLKAFTKIYAMAGIRLGYGICYDTALLCAMEQVRQPWSVSAFAQAAGIAALPETFYVEKTRNLVAEGRNYLKECLEALGFRVYDSMANYIFFRDETGTAGAFYEACLKKGVLIRSCGNYKGLDGRYYRICVKTSEENEALIRIFEEIRMES